MTKNLQDYLADCQDRINTGLDRILPQPDAGPATKLYQALRYSVLNGGKRVRPLLCCAAAEATGELSDTVIQTAMAVELIHAYSLIHDDLPAMDNDELRRGRPTCHIAFDEATAILAGDALQALAFETLSTLQAKPENIVRLTGILAQASGPFGMVGGQAIDITAVNARLNLDQLKHMHRCKTGALIKASVLMGSIASENYTGQQLNALENYGENLGLAFQIQDDVLDETSDSATLGKNTGVDRSLNKPTYTRLLGIEQAKKAARDLKNSALAALDIFEGRADYLKGLADFIVTRNY